MAAASTSAQKAQAPHVNLFDVPEMMPGAQPSANPAQRFEFEERCRKLHRDDESEAQYHKQENQARAGAAATISDLESMFPNLDPALIRTLRAEAPSAQHAIETLLALSAATADPGPGEQARPASPPPVPVGVEDHEKFPSLVDSQGWQVPGSARAREAADQEPGSAWRDRAKAARELPAPKPQPSAAALAWGKKREIIKKDERDQEAPLPETDYDFRHRAGQKRAENRMQYGRCRGKGVGKGASRSADAKKGEGEDESEESEASEGQED